MTGSRPALVYARVFEALPSPYLIMTADFTIVTVNPAYAAATMIDREAVVGRPMFDVFPDNPDDPGADGVTNLRRSLRTVVDTGRADAMALQRYDIRAPDGRFVVRYWSPVNTPVLDDTGAVALIVHRVHDVTDLVEARRSEREHQRTAAQLQTRVEQMEADLFVRARQLQETNQRLREVNAELAATSTQLHRQQQAKDRFIAILSHELRNPLAAARAALDLLATDLTDHPAQSVLDRQLKALTRLTDDLLDTARVATGRLTAHRRHLHHPTTTGRQGRRARPAAQASSPAEPANPARRGQRGCCGHERRTAPATRRHRHHRPHRNRRAGRHAQ